jgi:hypothetical protein
MRQPVVQSSIPHPSRLLSAQQVASVLGCTGWVYKMAKTPKAPAVMMLQPVRSETVRFHPQNSNHRVRRHPTQGKSE